MGVNYDILEKDFSKKHSAACQLSILVGMDSLFFFIFDAAENKALRLRTIPYLGYAADSDSFSQELQNLFQREEIFSQQFRRVRICLAPRKTVPVPSRLFNDAASAVYLRELTNELKPGFILQHEDLSDLGIKLVYEADPSIIHACKKQFPSCHISDQAAALITGAQRAVPEDQAHCLFVHFTARTLQLVLFDKHSLAFYNSFAYSTAADVLYFTLAVLNQFNIDPAAVPVSLSGTIVQDAEIFRVLSRYVGNLSFAAEPHYLTFSNRFKDVQHYFFFDLYAMALIR
ncbi:MAG: hypothetical protein RI973_273 [Bacteroidota bacterium]|jgi:hypothetical protein